MIMLNSWYFWQERLEKMVVGGKSPWFDDIGTKDRTESLDELFHMAALEAKKFLTTELGNGPEKWKWGTLHTLELVNPIMRKGAVKSLFGSGPMPMGGSGETLTGAGMTTINLLGLPIAPLFGWLRIFPTRKRSRPCCPAVLPEGLFIPTSVTR